MTRRIINFVQLLPRLLFIKYSWLFGVVGVVLAAIGGVITNATVGSFLKNYCGEEGKACFHGVVSFMVSTPEGIMVVLGGIFTSLSIFASYTDKSKIDYLESENRTKDDQIDSLTILRAESAEILNKMSIDTYRTLSIYLKHLASEMGLKVDDRISLYKVSDDHFF